MINNNDIDKNKHKKENDQQESMNIVNVHDPFFLWSLLEHSDQLLIQANETFSDAPRNFRTARDSIEKLSNMTNIGADETPDLKEIYVPPVYPTSPDFIVKELRDGSFISYKGKPLKFTVLPVDKTEGFIEFVKNVHSLLEFKADHENKK
ncbi:unnamed protein product [Rotaria sp. Silwood2]|nr:unnamed protein product [Rotaria sp. Silwood2]